MVKRQLKRKHQNLSLVGIAFIALIVISLGLASAHHSSAFYSSGNAYIKSLTNKWLAQCYTQDCVYNGMEKLTAQAGPKLALQSLEYYVHNVPNYLPGDDHLRAHHVGYQLFRTYGLSTKAFLMCDPDFNNGCMHGYIEEAQAKLHGSAWSLGNELCKPLNIKTTNSYNQKHFCYHGVGHAIMEDVNYNLTAALKECDSYNDVVAETGCWQGAFMENEWGYVSKIADNGTFSRNDLMAPCDHVAQKYQTQCYMNQEGYLLNVFNNDPYKAAKACQAAGDNAGVCAESLGLTASAEAWQPLLLKTKYTGNREADAWTICRGFPQQYIINCVTGAVFNILALDGLDFSGASRFCGLVNSAYQTDCYSDIGQYAWVQTPAPNPKKVDSYCIQVPSRWQATCRQGATQHA